MTLSECSRTSKSEPTMSTSERKPVPPASESENSWTEVWIPGKDLPAGVPDPAVIARMANEFFTALPEFAREFAQLTSSVPAAPSQLPPVPAGTASQSLPQGITGITPPGAFPTEADLRALPDSLAVSALSFSARPRRNSPMVCDSRWFLCSPFFCNPFLFIP